MSTPTQIVGQMIDRVRTTLQDLTSDRISPNDLDTHAVVAERIAQQTRKLATLIEVRDALGTAEANERVDERTREAYNDLRVVMGLTDLVPEGRAPQQLAGTMELAAHRLRQAGGTSS